MQTSLENFAIDFKKNLTSSAIDSFTQTNLVTWTEQTCKSMNLRKPLPQGICEDYVIDCLVMIVYYMKKSTIEHFHCWRICRQPVSGKSCRKAAAFLMRKFPMNWNKQLQLKWISQKRPLYWSKSTVSDWDGSRRFRKLSSADMQLWQAHISYGRNKFFVKMRKRFFTLYKKEFCGEKIGGNIVLNFPSIKPQVTDHEDLIRNLFPTDIGLAGNHFLFSCLLWNLLPDKPDFKKISKLPKYGRIITLHLKENMISYPGFSCSAGAAYEYPVTGLLIARYALTGQANLGRINTRAYQASKRGRVVGVELKRIGSF